MDPQSASRQTHLCPSQLHYGLQPDSLLKYSFFNVFSLSCTLYCCHCTDAVWQCRYPVFFVIRRCLKDFWLHVTLLANLKTDRRTDTGISSPVNISKIVVTVSHSYNCSVVYGILFQRMALASWARFLKQYHSFQFLINS